MPNATIKKWIEPYVLLETLKKKYQMSDITFDGITKEMSKNKMFKAIQNSNNQAFGLYMKNVNKFYIFQAETALATEEVMQTLDFQNEDYELTQDRETPIKDVDVAKAEAAIIMNV